MMMVLGFTAYTRKNRVKRKTFWQRNGPLILIAIAIPLILADTTRHVLQDENLWPACIKLDDGSCAWYSSAEYKAGEAETVQDENLTHLSTIGVLFTIVATYSGFIILAVGTLWNADIVKKWGKIKAKWAALRKAAAASGKPKQQADTTYTQLNSVA